MGRKGEVSDMKNAMKRMVINLGLLTIFLIFFKKLKRWIFSKDKIYLVYIIIFINIAHYFKSEISKSWLVLGL